MNILTVADWMVQEYARTFLNRLAYSRQRHTPDEKGRAPFFLCREHPKRGQQDGKLLQLGPREVQQHLMGLITIGIYSLSLNSTCRWLAIDADYPGAQTDLTALEKHLRGQGITARIEDSRRGGHLWIFTDEPVPAADANRFLIAQAEALNLPLKGQDQSQGLEIFPRQTSITKEQFGLAIRGPLGVHRKDNKRYWFIDAQPNLTAQLEMLHKTPRLSLTHLRRLAPPSPEPTSTVADKSTQELVSETLRFTHAANPSSRYTPFRILDYIYLQPSTPRLSGNYVLQCPACAAEGRDNHEDNLHIKISEPNKYVCRAGCSADRIRAALGAPPRVHHRSLHQSLH